MKILAINGSPRAKRSNTNKILLPFLDGAREAGAGVELLYVKDLDIKPCQGCYTCHMKTPGVCIFKDDMPEVMEKMRAADTIVFAMSLYVFSVPAIFKAFLDRMMVVGDLKVEVVDGLTVHPPRWPDIKWNWVIISNAGFPEDEHFNPMRDMFKRFAWAIGGGGYVKVAASICKGMGELLGNKPLLPQFEWFFEACRKAGSEVVRDGCISPETQAILDKPLMPVTPTEFAELANVFIEKAVKIIREKAE
jgi:putative NADPH-quinone reductase